MVYRLGADNSRDRALLAVKRDLSACQHRRIYAADTAKGKHSVLSYIRDHKSDLVHVRRDHYFLFLLALTKAHNCDKVAHSVNIGSVSHFFSSRHYQLSYLVLASRGTKGKREKLYQLSAVQIHYITHLCTSANLSAIFFEQMNSLTAPQSALQSSRFNTSL